MNFLVVGLNYRTAPLQLRERLAIAPRDLPAALQAVRTIVHVDEAVILSTCNRVEVYVTSSSPSATFQELTGFLASRGRLVPEVLQPCLYHLIDREAEAHLFRVTAGLDSMILGESQITAQVKQAYLTAWALGLTRPTLNCLFQKALHSAKVVRSNTRIAEGQASIGSAVVALARQLFGGRLTACEVLLWGAGKAAEATARHLLKGGIGQLWIVNRTQPKAQDLASLCQGGWLSWEQALKHLAHVDIAIVCTQAPHYVIDPADVAAVLPQRCGRPLLIVDLAVPRNVDPVIRTMPLLYLYDIDDLQATTEASHAARTLELVRCESIIQEQVGQLIERERTDQSVRWEGVMAQGGGL